MSTVSMLSSDYVAFLQSKGASAPAELHEMPRAGINPNLFDFQTHIVQWCLARPCAAVFADTGLGKSRMLLAYSQAVAQTNNTPVLVLTPLCTAKQLAREAEVMEIDVPVKVVRCMREVGTASAIYITNYEIVEKFELGKFGALVLDESSILKHKECATARWLITNGQVVPRRLSLTATPCPNDFSEIMHQSEFLGVATRDELLSTFFVREDTTRVRLREHAAQAFMAWMATWSVWVTSPADIGFSHEAPMYVLPELRMHDELVDIPGWVPTPPKKKSSKQKGAEGGGLMGRLAARKLSQEERLRRCIEMVNEDRGERWIVWCTLNEESSRLTAAIDGAVELAGTHSQKKKDAALTSFVSGEARVLVTKSEIAGFGLNFQFCHKMVFVSLTDSYERMHQAIRRCYRFGQTQPVEVVLMTSEAEKAVRENLERKSQQSNSMREGMAAISRGCNLQPQVLKDVSAKQCPVTDVGAGCKIITGDCVRALLEHVADNSVDYTIFSPPFAALYRYSASPEDLSNCKDEAAFTQHMAFVARELFRTLKPGRLMSFHVMNICRRRLDHGDEVANSIIDLRGMLTRVYEDAGFLMHSEVCVFRDPTQALIRTKAQGLFYNTFLSNATVARQALPDYVVTMRKPGIPVQPVTHDTTAFPMDDWISMACPVWFVRPADTLNVKKMLAEAPGMCQNTRAVLSKEVAAYEETPEPAAVEDAEGSSSGLPAADQKHPTPLQLEIIRRCVQLWTNPGDVVLDPFCGVGSTGVVSKQLGRGYVGIELQSAWAACASKALSGTPAHS